ncbi:hypothetical protein ABZ032_003018 [Listeria monocytogenes]
MEISKREAGTKRFQFLKILIIKPFKYIIKCEKRTKQNSDYQKTSFVRFLYLRSDLCPSLLSIVFGLSSKTQWLSGLYYADFISFYSPTQLCGGGTTKSNSNELPISVPLSSLVIIVGKARAAIWQINRATLAKTIAENGCLHRMVIRMRIDAEIGNLLQAKVKTLGSQTLDLSI